MSFVPNFSFPLCLRNSVFIPGKNWKKEKNGNTSKYNVFLCLQLINIGLHANKLEDEKKNAMGYAKDRVECKNIYSTVPTCLNCTTFESDLLCHLIRLNASQRCSLELRSSVRDDPSM